jgi:hypothetical protein
MPADPVPSRRWPPAGTWRSMSMDLSPRAPSTPLQRSSRPLQGRSGSRRHKRSGGSRRFSRRTLRPRSSGAQAGRLPRTESFSCSSQCKLIGSGKEWTKFPRTKKGELRSIVPKFSRIITSGMSKNWGLGHERPAPTAHVGLISIARFPVVIRSGHPDPLLQSAQRSG